MPDRNNPSAFWDRVARRYERMAMRNPDAYEKTLAQVTARLGVESRVLELGCGTGSTAIRLAPLVKHYTASDYSAEMIAIAREKKTGAGVENLELHHVRPGAGSLPAGLYDAVLAFNVLHLLPDRSAAFADIFERLSPEGLFISKTPCLSGFYRMLQPVVAALRLIGKAPDFTFLPAKTLEADIQRAGFSIVERGSPSGSSIRHFIIAIKKDAESSF